MAAHAHSTGVRLLYRVTLKVKVLCSAVLLDLLTEHKQVGLLTTYLDSQKEGDKRIMGTHLSI